ncbi:hypothetical protein ES703_04289 [subsurface metagenome]
MKTISLKIPEDLYNLIYQLSKKRGQNISSIIRETLKEYLSPNNKSNSISFLSKAKDKEGCLNGAEDLSSNKAYLKGYGS